MAPRHSSVAWHGAATGQYPRRGREVVGERRRTRESGLDSRPLLELRQGVWVSGFQQPALAPVGDGLLQPRLHRRAVNEGRQVPRAVFHLDENEPAVAIRRGME